jgi:hypothetical protein
MHLPKYSPHANFISLLLLAKNKLLFHNSSRHNRLTVKRKVFRIPWFRIPFIKESLLSLLTSSSPHGLALHGN